MIGAVNGISMLDWTFILSVMVLNVYLEHLGMWPYSLFTLPGTCTHELSHYFMAKLCFAEPRLPSLWPRRNGNTWIMGSVEFVPTFINVVPIALSPFLLFPFGILFAAYCVHPAAGWQYILYSWIGGNMLFACIPSKQDWKVAAPTLLFATVLAALIYFY